MSELPYNLIKASMYKQVKEHCLCNFEWLSAKIAANSITSVLDDFIVARSAQPEDLELKILSHTLFLSANTLAQSPAQLATQLVGRLQDIISADVPIAPQDPLALPYLHSLLRQAKNCDHPCLIPSASCLSTPNNDLFDLLSGHKQPITALTNTSDGHRGVTASKDNTVKLWDLKTGHVIKSISSVGRNVHMLRTALENTVIITSETSQIRIWEIASGKCVKVIDGFIDPAPITLAQQGHILVAYFDGSFIMRSWTLTPHITLLKEVDLEAYRDKCYQDDSITVAYNSNGDEVLAAFRGSCNGLVHNVTSGALVHELKNPKSGSSIINVGISRDYFILGSRSMQMNEMYQLDLFDIFNGKYIRPVRGCQSDASRFLTINQIGSHAISVCGSEDNSSTIAVWNLVTGEHSHLAHHSAVSTMCACLDMRFVLTASRDECSLRIWNLMNVSKQQTVLKLKERRGVKNVQIMREHSQYSIAESFQEGTVFVTNLRCMNYLGKVVMHERKLFGKQDVILFRDHTAVILTDRTVNPAADVNGQVFQTVQRYNLKTKRYEKKAKNCFIYPSPSQDYRVLNDFRLMGLSENRGHFIVWSTSNGHILYRIKPNFRTQQREQGAVTDLGLALADRPVLQRTTSMMTPWDKRTETKMARHQRKKAEQDREKQRIDDLRREKDNAVHQFILSKDETVIVASFYAHHICVFDVENHTHTGTLEDEHSMLSLYIAALTPNGGQLVLVNYDEQEKTGYVTLWDCKSCHVQKRLKNEKNVSAIAINDTADRIVFGKENSEMCIWDHAREKSLQKIQGYTELKFGVDSRIHLIANGAQAAVFAGDISLWDLEKAEILAVFTPDMRIQSFELAMNGELLVFGLRDTERVISLRLNKKHRTAVKFAADDIFNERSNSSEEEDDDDDEEEE